MDLPYRGAAHSLCILDGGFGTDWRLLAIADISSRYWSEVLQQVIGALLG
jgi:hypothetical protein